MCNRFEETFDTSRSVTSQLTIINKWLLQSYFYSSKLLKDDSGFKESPWLQNWRVSFFTLKHRVQRAILSWSHHGLSLLAVPEHYIVLNIIINMDVQSQPGPVYVSLAETPSVTAGSRVYSLSSGVSVWGNSHSLDRDKLLSYRYKVLSPLLLLWPN